MGIEIVDVPRAREIVQSGEVLVCDARRGEDFDAGHLPGAVSFPFESREEAFNELAALFTPDQPVMVYCSGRDCDDALLLGTDVVKDIGRLEAAYDDAAAAARCGAARRRGASWAEGAGGRS